MDYNLLSDTNIYRNTYHELVCWVKELSWWNRYLRGLDELNKAQAKRIMELEFDLRRYSSIMVDDKQESVMTTYGTPEDNVISFAEAAPKVRRGGGGGTGKSVDWLSDMTWGTQLFVRMKVGQREPWMLVKFLYAGKKQKTCFLVPMMGDEQSVGDDRQWLPVDPEKFCKIWELFDEIKPIPLESEDG